LETTGKAETDYGNRSGSLVSENPVSFIGEKGGYENSKISMPETDPLKSSAD